MGRKSYRIPICCCRGDTTIRAGADHPVSEEGKGEIQLTSEDYLQGVIGMVNELVCFLPASFPLSDLRRDEALMTSLDYLSIQLLLRTLICPPESLLSSMTFSLLTP
jgi:hypothetical protein